MPTARSTATRWTCCTSRWRACWSCSRRIEIYASYADYLDKAFLPLMLGLMVTKFLLVVLFFMHLKWDSKLFGRLFWAGALLAVAVYVGALATFEYFAKA